ncbi:MAG: 3-keto-5-aminohexanoate cleavage protein [Halomonas sp.]|uniref:3-keto-5-aminohexanoate cleavage protein n=1 Tax=Halomonas sp. TaxID=1486246 RepID=UPI002ACD4549|nr:3-keto-5-aminohexanoate cleavage protein [Halomonas sp.]MDZ7851713.1 3-keto-5-aminohexanoate cleavage protein [Halomonas sp.]
MAAQAVLLGGHARVGLEDNLYLEKGVLATNAQLVEKASSLFENLGARVMSPAETRAHLKLRDPRTGQGRPWTEDRGR